MKTEFSLMASGVACAARAGGGWGAGGDATQGIFGRLRFPKVEQERAGVWEREKYAAPWWPQSAGTSTHWGHRQARSQVLGVWSAEYVCSYVCGERWPELGCAWVSCMSLFFMLLHVRFLIDPISFHTPNSRNSYSSSVKRLWIQREQATCQRLHSTHLTTQ